MAEVFTTGMLGPHAVRKLNELWDVASNAAEGIVNVSTDPNNAVTLGSDLGIFTPAVDGTVFFRIENRFYEIAEDETAKQTARSNLGLSTIDGGTFN